MRTCNYCGAEVSETAKFCRKCGAKLWEPEPIVSETGESEFNELSMHEVHEAEVYESSEYEGTVNRGIDTGDYESFAAEAGTSAPADTPAQADEPVPSDAPAQADGSIPCEQDFAGADAFGYAEPAEEPSYKGATSNEQTGVYPGAAGATSNEPGANPSGTNQQEAEQRRNRSRNGLTPEWDHTAEFDEQDISDNKVLAMSVYLLGALGVIIGMLGSHNSPYAGFHVRQSLKFVVLESLTMIAAVLLAWTIVVPLAAVVFRAILLIVKIACFFSICKGRAKEPAIVRGFKFLK